MKKALLATTLLCCVGAAQASESPKWDFVSVSYQSVDVLDETLSGFGLSGSKLLSENVFVAANYGQASDDIGASSDTFELEVNTLSLGLGYRHALSANTDVYGIVSYEDAELKVSYGGDSGSISDDGYGLYAGMRSMISEAVELGGSVAYVSIDGESDTAVGLSALYHFNEQFSLGLSHGRGDDVDTTSLSASLYF